MPHRSPRLSAFLVATIPGEAYLSSRKACGRQEGQAGSLSRRDKHGPPTLEDLHALTKALSGRGPTPEEVKEAREIYEAALSKHRGRLHVRELRPDEDAIFRRIHHAAVHGLAAGHYPQEILDKWSVPIREDEKVQPRREGQIRLVASTPVSRWHV